MAGLQRAVVNGLSSFNPFLCCLKPAGTRRASAAGRPAEQKALGEASPEPAPAKAGEDVKKKKQVNGKYLRI